MIALARTNPMQEQQRLGAFCDLPCGWGWGWGWDGINGNGK